MNSHSVPMKGRSRVGVAGRRTLDRRLQGEHRPFQRCLQARRRLHAQRRVPNQASPASTAISSQVVSTVAPM